MRNEDKSGVLVGPPPMKFDHINLKNLKIMSF